MNVSTLPVVRAVVCLVKGHAYRVLRCAGVHYLQAFHPLAGKDAVCARCGHQWRDYDDVVEVERGIHGVRVSVDCFTCEASEPTQVESGRYP